MQFALVQQNQDPTYDTDRGMELDNLEQNFEAMPRSAPTMANFTLIGKSGELGANPRRGTGGNFSNFIFTGFSSCINIDDAATFNDAGAPPFPAGLTGVLTMENTIVNCPTNFVEDPADPWSTQVFFDSQPGNMEMNPNLDGVFPPENASYTQGFYLDPEVYGEFFDHVDYIGAFYSRDSAWIWNWTEFYNW